MSHIDDAYWTLRLEALEARQQADGFLLANRTRLIIWMMRRYAEFDWRRALFGEER